MAVSSDLGGNLALAASPLDKSNRFARLDWSLALLAEQLDAVEASDPTLAMEEALRRSPRLGAMKAAGLLRTSSERVQVWAWASGNIASGEAVLRSLGVVVERDDPGQKLLQAWIPVGSLRAVAASGAFRFLSVPAYGFANTGSVASQGDALLNAALLRSTAGVDGAGVRVGLTSDSVKGLATAIASGDLPGGVNITTCNTKGNDPTSFGSGEGTAMLEIVHDLAPGAQLFFGNWGFATALDFNAAIDCLAANTDVVIDDIGFFNAGPYDGTSLVSQNTSDELNRSTNRARLYATSVGNYAQDHYKGAFVDSGATLSDGSNTWKLHRFAASGTTSDAGIGASCSGVPCTDSVVVAQGGTVKVFLQWSDSFAGSANDYDLFLGDRSTGAIVAQSNSNQNGSQPPVEGLAYTNPHAKGTFDILIGRFSGAVRTLEYYVLCSGCDTLSNAAKHNFNTLAGSVPNQSDAGGGVLSIGAINASDPNSDDIATYSSRGPTGDGRGKPDLTAIDGVSVTGAAGFANPFFGTSAAAPHVAGIAALLLNKAPGLLAGEPGDNPTTDRAALRSALLTSARDRGVAGVDNTFGTGLVDAAAAGALLGSSGPCVRDADTACLQSNRFEVNVQWTTGSASGAAPVMSFGGQRTENDESVFFTFFSPTNFEMGVKVLNACIPAFGNKYWVFVSGLTDQGWTVTVRDTVTGSVKTYGNAVGHLSTTFADTSAFGC